MGIIAITDHNTVSWCDQVREAAEGTSLHVLPGAEITAPEGHLLAIFDAAKPTSEIKEVLIQIGIRERDFGSQTAMASIPIDEVAKKIEADGGVAIAAHVDGSRGFMQSVGALHAQFIEDHIVSTLRDRRGMRQYLFATRNANALVSGDAEQVFVLEGDDTHGRIERSGSIDRLTTRDLIVLNLEGGQDAFARRSRKYGIQPP